MNIPCCPYCGIVLNKIPKRKTKCKECKNFFYYKRGPNETEKRIVTEFEKKFLEAMWLNNGHIDVWIKKIPPPEKYKEYHILAKDIWEKYNYKTESGVLNRLFKILINEKYKLLKKEYNEDLANELSVIEDVQGEYTKIMKDFCIRYGNLK